MSSAQPQSDAPVQQIPSKGRSLAIGEAVLQGRVSLVRRMTIGGKPSMIHLVILPAPDQYSSPATVEVMASKRLGDVDEDIRVRVRIGGFRRTYKATDKETGEISSVQTADVKLFAVED